MLGWQKRYLDGRKPQLIELAAWGCGDRGHRGGRWQAPRMGWSPSTSIPTMPRSRRDRQGVAGDAGLENRPERRDQIFHGPEITTSQSWNIDGKRVCDLIGPGGRRCCRPRSIPYGQPYRWQGAGLEHYDPEDLPLITPDIIGNIGAALTPFGWHPDPAAGQWRQWRQRCRHDGTSIRRRHAASCAQQLRARASGAVGAGARAIQVPAGARRLRGSGDLAAILDRAAGQGRKLNLKIMPAGIRDLATAASATAAAIPRSIW